MQQVIEKCKSCGKPNVLNSILQNQNFMKDGKSIRLTYFDCPKCGERCFVQIDDDTSLAMLDSVKKTFIKLAFKKQQGKKISKKDNSKFAEARANLGIYRTKLMKAYTGKTIFDEVNRTEFTLRFFV